MTEQTTRRNTDLAILDSMQNSLSAFMQMHLPPDVSRQLQTQLTREMEKIRAISEIGGCVMDEMSETERHAVYKAATTLAATSLFEQAALSILSPAEQAAWQQRRETYIQRMGQIADATNTQLLIEFDQAIKDLNQHTFADAVEDFNARVLDAVSSRRALPGGRR